jgi:hypothetical protein
LVTRTAADPLSTKSPEAVTKVFPDVFVAPLEDMRARLA